jgi:hypothetical protein
MSASSLDLTANYPWTGTHSFVAGKLKIGGAAAGVAILQYVSSTTDRTLTIPDPGANDTFVMVALAQSLTNKTLVAPVITGGATIGGDVNFDSGTFFVEPEVGGDGGHSGCSNHLFKVVLHVYGRQDSGNA